MFCVGTDMKYTNRAIKYVLQASAITVFLAFMIDSWLGRLNDKDSEELRDKLSAAQRATENLRADNLKLQERLSPRRLSPEQNNRVASKLAAFAGQRMNVRFAPGDGEI